MITVNDRCVNVPTEDFNIGFMGDNNIVLRQFEISNPLLMGCFFKLDVKQKAKNIIDLNKAASGDRLVLTWTIKKEHLTQNGILTAQLRAFDNDTLVWHSEKFIFNIKESINATDHFAKIEPSEFEQIEQRVTIAKEEAIAAAESAAQSAEVTAHTAYIGDNGNWYIWDNAVGDYVDSGASALTKDGKDGVDGKDGADGKDGLPGTDGKDGKDGTDGEDGADGLTTSVNINGTTYTHVDGLITVTEAFATEADATELWQAVEALAQTIAGVEQLQLNTLELLGGTQ